MGGKNPLFHYCYRVLVLVFASSTWSDEFGRCISLGTAVGLWKLQPGGISHTIYYSCQIAILLWLSDTCGGGLALDVLCFCIRCSFCVDVSHRFVQATKMGA